MAYKTGIFKWKILVWTLLKKYLKFPVRINSHSRLHQPSLLCLSCCFPFTRHKVFRFFHTKMERWQKHGPGDRFLLSDKQILFQHWNEIALCGHLWAGIYLAHQICSSEGTIPRPKVNSAQEVVEKRFAMFALCSNTGVRFVVQNMNNKPTGTS